MRMSGLRRMVLEVFAAGLVLAAAQAAGAATLTGLSGMITVPTADVLPVGAFEAELLLVGEEADDDILLAATFSVGAIENVEIAGTTLTTQTQDGDIELVLKGLVLAETADQPGVAVGFEPGRAFVVVSKRLSPRIRAHAGYGYGDEDGVFGGASIALTTASAARSALRTPAITAMGEYTPRGINVGARLILAPSLAVDAGLLDLSGENDYIVGVSYRRSF